MSPRAGSFRLCIKVTMTGRNENEVGGKCLGEGYGLPPHADQFLFALFATLAQPVHRGLEMQQQNQRRSNMSRLYRMYVLRIKINKAAAPWTLADTALSYIVNLWAVQKSLFQVYRCLLK